MLQANTAIEVESSYAWVRLAASVAIGAIATVGMWSVPVVLSAVQSDFGVARADASLPCTLAMTGFALGGVLMGRLSDRFGILAPLACGAASMGLGYIGAGLAPSLMVFALMHLLIGFGTSATFGRRGRLSGSRAGASRSLLPAAATMSGRNLATRRSTCSAGLARNAHRRRRVLRGFHRALPFLLLRRPPATR
jgi:MFS family permease